MHTPKATDLAVKAERGLVFLVSGTAFVFAALFYFIAVRRLSFPLSLEWAEGGILDMVRRAASHQAIYVAPSKDYVPFLYTPLYFYLSAALTHLMGVTFVPLRVLSIAATTGCLLLIFNLVWRNTGDRFAAWVSCGLFTALYAQSNGWFDVGRVDMLYLFFLLLAISLAQRGFAVWAAIAFAAAFQTKQSAALVAVFVLAHEIRRPRRLFAGLGAFGLATLVSSWAFDRQSHGWYRYYTAFLPSHQAWSMAKFLSFWLRDIFDPLSVALVLVLLGSALFLSEAADDRRRLYFLVCTTIGITLSTVTARLHLGGAINVTIPMYAWICILFGLSLHTILLRARRAPAGVSAMLSAVTLAACLIQFVHLIYSPRQYLPTHEQKVLAAEIARRVAATPGRIFVMHHVIDAGSADKQGFAGGMEVWDVLRADDGEVGRRLKADLIRSFNNQEYDGILCDRSPGTLYEEENDSMKEVAAAAGAAYQQQRRFLTPAEEQMFYTNPVTPQVKPQFLYTPQ